jgi:hypothetical protein
MRFYALARMLAEAETSALTGREAEAARQLRELLACGEELTARLAAGETGPRDLVAA